MQDLGELAKEEAIHIGPGWIVVFGLLLLLNLYLAYHYLNIPHYTHKKFKSVACLVLHIGLTIATVWYFTQLFHGKTQSGFINILMVLAGIYLVMFAYCVTLFLITDLFKLINKIVKFPERVRNFGKNIYRNGLTIFIIAILLTVYGFWQPHHFVVKPYDLTLDARASQIEELNIVMISDAHVGASVRGNELAEIREKINALNPDVIVLDGDIFDEGTTDALKQITSDEFKKLKAKYGVYYTIGNHDDYMGGTAKQISYFDNNVVTPLIDETIKVADSFYLIGRADSPEKRASLKELTADVTEDLPVIVLDHRPTVKETSEDPLVQLQISGHTHDGQIYPGILTRPTAKSGKYGLHKVGTCELLVSCGVGTYAVPVRIGSTCEIVQLKVNFDGAAVENDPALEKYIADIRPKTEETIASAKEEGMVYSVFARGSALVHRYKYIEDIGNLETARYLFGTYANLFEKAAKEEIIKLEAAGVKSPSVIFLYSNPDGAEIYFGEFK